MKLSIHSIVIFLLIGLSSCKQETKSTVNNDEPIEIRFLKEGELVLKNNDSILKQVDIEIAKSDNERSIGLMNRSSLEETQGMLFVFDQMNTSGFYMKDTRIPLDIIFIGADSTIISISKNRQPYDMTSEGATEPYKYVLELNGGLSESWGLQEGVTKIDWTETR